MELKNIKDILEPITIFGICLSPFIIGEKSIFLFGFLTIVLFIYNIYTLVKKSPNSSDTSNYKTIQTNLIKVEKVEGHDEHCETHNKILTVQDPITGNEYQCYVQEFAILEIGKRYLVEVNIDNEKIYSVKTTTSIDVDLSPFLIMINLLLIFLVLFFFYMKYT